MSKSSSGDDTARLSTPDQSGARRPGAVLLRVAIPLGILALGIGAYSLLSVEPERTPSPPPEARAIRTRALDLSVEDFQPEIISNGIIRPHNEVTLTPEVAGRIIQIHPGFEDGAFFAKGDVLVELDPVDFEAAVVIAGAQVARAEAAYSQEETRANQAELNWKDLGYTTEPSDLVLRKPQLREAKANVDSSQAQLAQAKRDLERTKIRAPFDGRVRQRTVGLGQSIGPANPLGTVFAVDYAEVRLPVEGKELAYVTLPETSDDPPVAVALRDAINTGADTVWGAEIIRTEGTLDADSLELFAIARVDDPFGRKSGKPPLRIGQPVTAAISGAVLRGVIAIPRSAVQQLNKIHLIDPDSLTLSSKTVDPIWKNRDSFIIRDPSIMDGVMLATTRLVYAPDGAKVEIIPEIEPDNDAGSAQASN